MRDGDDVGGSTPGRGPYGAEVDRCLDYVLKNTQESGYIVAPRRPAAPDSRPMYGHGFATMFLAECYGMARRPELRVKLGKAVQLIVNCQNEEGGWRYLPLRKDADISVTVCQVMALRAARNAGIFVPPENIDRAIDYVKKCQNADGGFMYYVGPGEAPSAFPRSAAAVVGLYSAGIRRSTRGRRSPRAELPHAVSFRSAASSGGTATTSTATTTPPWRCGRPGASHWSRWYPAIRDELLRRPAADRLVGRLVGLQRVRHGHGLPDPPDAEQLRADLSALGPRG